MNIGESMQEGSLSEVDIIARKLSTAIDCTLRLSLNRKLLVCGHHELFSLSRLTGTNDWSWAKTKHEKFADKTHE